MLGVDTQLEPIKIVGYCEGCGGGIEAGEKFFVENDGTQIHDDPFCCQEYVSKSANKTTAD